ncbi:hypothetical protein NYR55_09405 [Sphingomonas sp. BGYR3]|uniref:hypothetical protein n=1 Tax=Sphingomonas sp. BGYR3 TaxID=2975483 RepID=UPI0021A9431E|nr:hypothetical protein [Sphingomonas sp. BGYR3]MDG5488829.1 hypothetical protein [Sphingomonas sp. BGYR3]
MSRRFKLLATAALFATHSTVLEQGQVAQHRFRQLDENGVDLTHGDFIMAFREASIGSGDAELDLFRRNATNRSTDWELLKFGRFPKMCRRAVLTHK